jgi:hypothetical protein
MHHVTRLFIAAATTLGFVLQPDAAQAQATMTITGRIGHRPAGTLLLHRRSGARQQARQSACAQHRVPSDPSLDHARGGTQ